MGEEVRDVYGNVMKPRPDLFRQHVPWEEFERSCRELWEQQNGLAQSHSESFRSSDVTNELVAAWKASKGIEVNDGGGPQALQLCFNILCYPRVALSMVQLSFLQLVLCGLLKESEVEIWKAKWHLILLPGRRDYLSQLAVELCDCAGLLVCLSLDL